MNILNTFNYIYAIIKTGFALKVNFIFYFRLNTCSNKFSIFKYLINVKIPKKMGKKISKDNLKKL